MKIVFFGLGSIGRRHARLIKANFKHELYAYRSNKKSIKNDLGIKEIFDLSQIDEIKPEIAFITNPTSKHIETAVYCAKRGMHLFIEKPISNNKKEIEKLQEIIKKNNIKSYTAYHLRFHPVIVWIKKYFEKNRPIHLTVNNSSYLPNWRKNTNHLDVYSAHKKMGGGIILDQSHEIDYLCYLLGNVKNVKANSKRIGNVTVDSEDFADILFEFENNIFCNLHLNFLSQLNRREITIDFKDHTVIGDLISNRVEIIRNGKRKIINFDLELDDIYKSQLDYFFSNLKKKTLMNNLDEALKIFDIILKVKRETNT